MIREETGAVNEKGVCRAGFIRCEEPRALKWQRTKTRKMPGHSDGAPAARGDEAGGACLFTKAD